MKKLFFLFAVPILVASCNGGGKCCKKDNADSTSVVADSAMNTLTAEEQAAGWVLLFDGKSTDQFRAYNRDTFPTAGWEVVDGTIHCKASGKGEAGKGGDIITKNKYKNFILKLEWKIDTGGNSGIFYLAQEKKDQSIWKSAPEMQILDNLNHPDATKGINGNRQAGSLYDLIAANPQNANPAGQWNQIEIEIYQGSVFHKQNGVQVLEYHLWTEDWKKMCADSKFKDFTDFVNTAEEGHIGLQDHGNNVWFRNIKILVK